jgi:hypothetical protein
MCTGVGDWPIKVTIVPTAGQRGDSPQFMPVLESIRVPRLDTGRTRVRPGRATCDVRAVGVEVTRRGIAVRIAREGIESSTRLGRHRWVIDSCLS